MAGFRAFAVREAVVVDLFDAVRVDFAFLERVGDLAGFALAADFADFDCAVFRGDLAVVVFRVDDVALVERLSVFFDAVVLLLVTVAGLRDDVLRVVVVTLDFAVDALDGVDFFRADDVFDAFDVVVLRVVVVAFLVAIVSLPAK